MRGWGLRLGRCIHCQCNRPVDMAGFLWFHNSAGVLCLGSGLRPGVNR